MLAMKPQHKPKFSNTYESNVAKFPLHGTQRLLSISTPFTKPFSSYKPFTCTFLKPFNYPAENYL